MAGDWIKLQHATPDKPEVFRMSRDLGIATEHVLGCLIRVWIWADMQTIDGNGVTVTSVTLDRIACNNGFAKAMKSVGWLLGDDDNFSFPNFDRHNGESAKTRASTQKRVKKHRNGNTLQGNEISVTREEKRREDIKPYVSHEKIVFDGTGFQNINGQMAIWKSAYPSIDIDAELKKASAWVVSTKAQKKQWGRFLNGWLSRAQERVAAVSVKPNFAGVL